jgi:hypothetical protein
LDRSRESRAQVVDLSPRIGANPAIPARSLLRSAGRVALWTVLWTLYQWWAVIGWPEGPVAVYASMAGTGLAGLVAAVVWRDVQRARQPAGRVIPFPSRAAPAAPPEDLAA